MGFMFTSMPGRPLTLRQAVYMAVNQVAVCWEHPDMAGGYDHDQAARIAEDLLAVVNEQVAISAGTAPSESQPLRDATFSAIGRAGRCWDRLNRAGRFDYDRARGIALELLEIIDRAAVGSAETEGADP